ncbi:hypothetical protein Taro_044191 [Colocasia esculenta]|uniref:Uncharacterized protein n=1 Tax=Colocasia esculenta TaxID=4460 RepID=A0A843WTY1_COLES|nr:hypothetical protein [Colocasia esculenta]
MVKLATARESRMYGPGRLSRNRWEYINAGLHVFAAVLLCGGFAAQLSYRGDAKSGLVVLLVSLAILAAVNAHDLVAHMAGIDFRVYLLGLDAQMALVELAVPLVQALGAALEFAGVLLLFIQAERGYGYRLEKHAVNTLIAGPAMWVLGSIHNLCQVYERADGHIQVLQKCVQIPFLMGSLLFLVGGVFNRQEVFGRVRHHGLETAGRSWAWLSLSGSLILLVGSLLNVVKVFKMQQMDGIRLEKLRGGAQERLAREREGRVPLILEENRRRPGGEARAAAPASTPYKDVLVGRS